MYKAISRDESMEIEAGTLSALFDKAAKIVTSNEVSILGEHTLVVGEPVEFMVINTKTKKRVTDLLEAERLENQKLSLAYSDQKKLDYDEFMHACGQVSNV